MTSLASLKLRVASAIGISDRESMKDNSCKRSRTRPASATRNDHAHSGSIQIPGLSWTVDLEGGNPAPNTRVCFRFKCRPLELFLIVRCF